MELATPPPAVRAPVAWYGWWLLPLALAAGTAVAAVLGPDGIRVPAAAAGVVVTGVSAACVRRLVGSRRELLRVTAESAAERAESAQQRQRYAADRADFETRLAEQARTYEERLAGQAEAHGKRLAEQAGAHDEKLAEQARTYEARLAEETRAWRERLDGQQALAVRVGTEYLPQALARLRAGDAIDDVLPAVTRDTDGTPEFRAALRKVLRTALIGVEHEFNRSTSAEQAVISIGNRIHVLTSKLRGRLHEMQFEHGRLPSVARGLMELDQEIGPADCLAASIGVLGGSDRPGRQWQEPQRLLSVVRGGIGRIKDFDRVEIRQLPELGVDGGLVDHLTLIFAHLLDNAARYSPPTEPVLVSGKEVPNGVGVEIQDSGKGLSEERKQEAVRSLAGEEPGPGLGGVSEDARLGLRVVGALARRYGIRVTFSDSPWLGTSVVVVVPHKYFTPLAAAAPAPAPAALTATATGTRGRTGAEAAPAPGAAGAAAAGAPDGEAADTTPGGLPRRRRRTEAAGSGQAGTEAGRSGQAGTEAARSGRAGGQDRAEGGTGASADVYAVPPDASFAGLAAFATAGRGTTTGRESGAGRETVADRGPAAGSGSGADHETTTGNGPASESEPVPDSATEGGTPSADDTPEQHPEHRTEESDWST